MEGQGSSSERKVVQSSGKFEYSYELHVIMCHGMISMAQLYKVPYKNRSDQDHDYKWSN